MVEPMVLEVQLQNFLVFSELNQVVPVHTSVPLGLSIQKLDLMLEK